MIAILFLRSLEVIVSSAPFYKNGTMEEYNDIRNDASTTTEVEHKKTLHQALQRQLKGEAERNQLANTGVLKTTSRNAIKRVKIKQDARVATRASKNAQTAIKQIANQELQFEKKRM